MGAAKCVLVYCWCFVDCMCTMLHK